MISSSEKPDYENAKKSALKLLDFFGYDEPPVNPLKIAHDLGITVYFVEFDAEKDKLISGFFNSKENTIYVNKNEFSSRKTFTIAHEIGHHQLHREWSKTSEYKILYRDQLSRKQADPKEQEANTFAANLLVPKKMLNKYKNYASISELATLFLVSESVIKFRLSDKNEYGI